MLEDSLPNRAHAAVEQSDTLQVKVISYKDYDTANNSPLGEASHLKGETRPPGTASRLLDKLLARTATTQQKLAGMSQSGQVSNQEAATRHPAQLAMVETPSPGAILDRCLAQARKLNLRTDKLSAEVAANQDKASNSEPARNAPWKSRTEKHQTLDATEPATKHQAAQTMALCSSKLSAASSQLSSSSPHASLHAVRSSAVGSTPADLGQQALQVMGGGLEALDAAKDPTLGVPDELVLESLRETAEALFDSKTAEKYMMQAVQTMASQPSPATPGQQALQVTSWC